MFCAGILRMIRKTNILLSEEYLFITLREPSQLTKTCSKNVLVTFQLSYYNVISECSLECSLNYRKYPVFKYVKKKS